MFSRRTALSVGLLSWIVMALSGCQRGTPSFALDSAVAHAALEKSMQAWVDGQTPIDLQPEIIIGDTDWNNGQKLVSYEILIREETTDGSNLHIPVKRRFKSSGKYSESQVAYIVGTSPVVTIFPQ